jgi:hypothetical protein
MGTGPGDGRTVPRERWKYNQLMRSEENWEQGCYAGLKGFVRQR